MAMRFLPEIPSNIITGAPPNLLAGFHLAWSGYKGRGRVLESGTTRFIEPVNEKTQVLRVVLHVRKVLNSKIPICIANREIESNGELKCRSDSIKVALF